MQGDAVRPKAGSAGQCCSLNTWRQMYSKGTLALLACMSAMFIGFSIVSQIARKSTDEQTQLMVAQHEETTAAAAKQTTAYIVSMISAAYAVRYVAEAGYLAGRRSPGDGPVSAVGRAIASRIYIPPPSFITTHAALSHENRSDYELSLNRRCGAALASSSLQLAKIEDDAVGITAKAASGAFLRPNAAVYPNRSKYTVISNAFTPDSQLQLICSFLGTVIDESSQRMRPFVRTIATGTAAWAAPRVTKASSTERNIGFYLAVQVPSAEEAQPFGALYAEILATAANASDHLRDACRPGDTCGTGDTTITVLDAPVLPSRALGHMMELLPEVHTASVTLIHIPFHLKPLLTLRHAAKQWPAKTLRTMLQARHEVPGTSDAHYLNESYFEEVTSPVLSGSLRPLLQQLDVGHILFAGKKGPAGDMHLIDAADALHDTIDGEQPHAMDSMQCSHVFALGPHVYLLVIRDKGEWIREELTRHAPYTWALGSTLTLLIAAVPLVAYWFRKREEEKHTMQLGLMQAERDGVVQAVAFAAHEIRNPMHGVLASLESAMEDVKPMYRFLLRAMEASKATSPENATAVSKDLQATKALLEKQVEPGAIEAVLNAFEDLAVAKSSAESCHRLVNDMVDYSKLQRGVMLLQRASMRVHESLVGLLASQRAFLHRGVSALFAAAADVPKDIHTDELRLLQLVTNGLTNASKFTQEGSVRLVVSVLNISGLDGLQLAHNTGDEWLAIAVIDSGKGLAGIDVDV